MEEQDPKDARARNRGEEGDPDDPAGELEEAVHAYRDQLGKVMLIVRTHLVPEHGLAAELPPEPEEGVEDIHLLLHGEEPAHGTGEPREHAHKQDHVEVRAPGRKGVGGDPEEHLEADLRERLHHHVHETHAQEVHVLFALKRLLGVESPQRRVNRPELEHGANHPEDLHLHVIQHLELALLGRLGVAGAPRVVLKHVEGHGDAAHQDEAQHAGKLCVGRAFGEADEHHSVRDLVDEGQAYAVV
mmetsp:Transcript_41533/g.132694  ORF Transcript_41533/g.132694 Transcript_41533/m.132694 type:complete len:244 (-) Transcript_41533:555-1286(-)